MNGTGFEPCISINDIENFSDFNMNYFGLNHFGWFTDISYKGRDFKKEIIDYIFEHKTFLPEASIEKLKQHEALNERHANASWIHT